MRLDSSRSNKANYLSDTFKSWDPSSHFVTKKGTLNKNIEIILSLEGLFNKEDNLAETVTKTQKAWIISIQGNNGKERVDIKDKPEKQLILKKIEQTLRTAGLFDAKEPLLDHYNYAACLGSFLRDVRAQLKMLCDAWEKGTRFDSLVFFTGERFLRKGENQEENIKNLKDPTQSPIPLKKDWEMPENASYETEYDMIKLLFEQIEMPKSMEEAIKDNVVFVNAEKGQNQRPSTRDTFNKWLQDFEPNPGTILVTTYPFVWVYQQLVGMHTLGPDYPLNPICPSVTEEELTLRRDYIVSVIEDTIAKCLFEIYTYEERGLHD